MNTYEKICFDERKIISIPDPIPIEQETELNDKLAATAIKKLEMYGFTIDEPGFRSLMHLDKESIASWYYETAEILKESIGGNVSYRSFYPDFPDRYMDDKDFGRFLEQIAHYWFGYRPEGEQRTAESLEEHPLKLLHTQFRSEAKKTARQIFENLLSSKMNLPSHELKNVVFPYIKEDSKWFEHCKVVTNRNTLCLLYSQALIDGNSEAVSQLPKPVAGDILRVAKIVSALREGYDLEEDSEIFIRVNDLKVGKLKNRDLKMLMDMSRDIIASKSPLAFLEDINKNKEQWKILFKLAHIGSYPSSYDQVKEVANAVRNNEKSKTFYSYVEEYTKEFNSNPSPSTFKKLLDIYRERPGVFIKSINRIETDIEKHVNANTMKDNDVRSIANEFLQAITKTTEKCDPADLFSLYEYMNSRTREDRLPIHNVKGKFVNSNKEYAPLSKLFAKVVNTKISTALQKQVCTPDLWADKNIYIDPALSEMVVPGKDRIDSSESFNQYNKGSKFAIEKNDDGTTKNVRLFIWWTNGFKQDPDQSSEHEKRVDIDLSVRLYKSDLSQCGVLSYYDSGNKYGCVHSGDITNGGPRNGSGVCEYIDLDTSRLKANGIKYVQCFVNSYCGYNFNGLNCKFGWMERDELDKSAQFDIKAVKQKSELSSAAAGITPVIFDVEEGKVIWVDSPDFIIQGGENIGSNSPRFAALVDKYTHGDRMDMGTLAGIITQGNGGAITDDKEKADIVFTVDEEELSPEQRNITSKDNDVWIGEFMTRPNISEEGPMADIADKKKTFQDVFVEESASRASWQKTDEERIEEQDHIEEVIKQKNNRSRSDDDDFER